MIRRSGQDACASEVDMENRDPIGVSRIELFGGHDRLLRGVIEELGMVEETQSPVSVS